MPRRWAPWPEKRTPRPPAPRCPRRCRGVPACRRGRRGASASSRSAATIDGAFVEDGTRGHQRRAVAARSRPACTARGVDEAPAVPPGAQDRGRPGPEDERHRGQRLRGPRCRGGLRLRCGRVAGRLLDDHVGVGAADPERRDAGPARPFPARPGTGLREQPDVARRPVDVRGGLVDVQGAGQDSWRIAMTTLMTPADTGSGLGCARCWTSPSRATAGAPGGAVPAVGGEQGLGLDRVAEAGARAVRLDASTSSGRRPARPPGPGG